MYVPFDQLSESARVWIYQANRPFREEEEPRVRQLIEAFLSQWTAHGQELHAGYELKYRRFIVIALDGDANPATGCSIDASVRFIQALEKEYDIDLMDKMNVTFRQGQFIAHKDLKSFKELASKRGVSGKTIVFNNLVTDKGDYLENWEVPASQSWHSRFIK